MRTLSFRTGGRVVGLGLDVPDRKHGVLAPSDSRLDPEPFPPDGSTIPGGCEDGPAFESESRLPGAGEGCVGRVMGVEVRYGTKLRGGGVAEKFFVAHACAEGQPGAP